MDCQPDLEDNPRPFVNTLPTPPSAASLPLPALSDENNNSNRATGRPSTILRSRRNPVGAPALSTLPNSASSLVDHTAPSNSGATQVSGGPQPQSFLDNNIPAAPCCSLPSGAGSIASSPLNPSCSSNGTKAKVHVNKELEQHSTKTQDVGNAVDISDFECSLCFRVFLQPVTTICGHVFCKQCLFSALKYSVQCPLCRHKLETSPMQHKYAVNVVLMNMIEKYFPKEHQERLDEDSHYQESSKASPDKQGEEENPQPPSPSWSCIIPSIRSTCNVILSCGGF